MRLAILAFTLSALVYGQADSPISTASGGNPNDGYTVIMHYNGANVDYLCKAKSVQNITPIPVMSISNANPGVVTTPAAHNFYFATGVTQKISVFVSGLTGSWTPLNGNHVFTPTGTNTLATDVDTTAFGAVTGTINVTTRAARTTDKVWAVQSMVYDAAGNLTITGWAVDTSATSAERLQGGTPTYRFACAAPNSFQ